MRAIATALILALALAPGAALAQPALTEAAVRDFVARQEQAWNAGALDRFFAGFAPDAQFTDQAFVGADKPPVPYGTSTLAQAHAQSRRALAKSRSREAGRIISLRLAPDGRSAQVVSRITTTLETGGKVRRLCASRGQAVILRDGRLVSRGQTDTFLKCSP